MEKSVSVVVPINALGEVLMGLRQEDGKWTTPAGGANPGESPVDCAIREAWEEAALEIIPNQLELLKVTKTPGGSISIFLLRCAKVFTSPESDPDQEVPEWGWYHPDSFPEDFYDTKNDIRRPAILEAVEKFNNGSLKKSEDKDKLLRFIHKIRVKNPELAEQVYGRLYPLAQEALDSDLPEIQKSVVQMAHHSDGGDLRTEASAVERAYSDPELLTLLERGMKDFSYGDIPVEFFMDGGTLFLTKVEDGLFSGFFQKREEIPGGDQDLLDNAKVRIERQTLGTLSQFLIAKGWWTVKPPEAEDSPLTSSFERLDHKIKILQLLDRIVN